MDRAREMPVRLIAFALALLLTATAASARQSTLGMSCRQAQNLLARSGAVVLSTGPHTYDRFVRSPGYCEVAQWADSATAPTRDSRACPLGYTCSNNPPIWYDRRGDGFLDF
jgi:hypothetical protein